MKRAMYLIGQPGAGKTTALGLALRGLAVYRMPKPIAHVVYTPTYGSDHVLGVQLGTLRDDFGGTDALALGVQPAAEKFVRGLRVDSLVAEGDRLANDKFFAALVEAGWELQVVWLDVPDELAAQRRAERGSKQNAAWVKGRQTKVLRLAEAWKAVRVDGTQPPAEVRAALEALPAIEQMHAYD